MSLATLYLVVGDLRLYFQDKEQSGMPPFTTLYSVVLETPACAICNNN